MKKRYRIERNYRDLGEYLRRAREGKGFTQRAVAEHLRYSSAQFISNFENGLNRPPKGKLAQLVRLYGLDPERVVASLLATRRALLKRELGL